MSQCDSPASRQAKQFPLATLETNSNNTDFSSQAAQAQLGRIFRPTVCLWSDNTQQPKQIQDVVTSSTCSILLYMPCPRYLCTRSSTLNAILELK